jgi:hypothetical protein
MSAALAWLGLGIAAVVLGVITVVVDLWRRQLGPDTGPARPARADRDDRRAQ